jgi:lipopolysaccharide export system permease protein
LRYVLARFLGSFLATLAILILGVMIVELLVDLDEIFEARGGLQGALSYVALRIPFYYLPYLIPVSSFAAAFLSLGLAARSLEVVAMKAGGVSPLRIVLPLLVAAAVISVSSLALNETVAVEASQAWRRQTRGGDGPRVTFRRGSFWYHRGRYIYNVREAEPSTRSLRKVEVYELDERGRLVRNIVAKEAEILADGDWLLRDASIRRLDPDRPSVAPVIEYVLETRLETRSGPDLALLEADVSSLSIRDLQEYLESYPEDEMATTRAAARLQQRLTEPLAAFVFALLAVPLGLRVEQTKSLARPALHGAILVFLFYTVREYGSTLALQGVTPPAVTFWSILALFGGVGLWQLARVPR